jgi:hypothetical protein
MHATHDNLSIPNGNMEFRSAGCADMTINELLADPLTGALMRADRVDVHDFENMLRSVARRIQARAPALPVVAVEAAVEIRPSIGSHISGMFLPRRSESTTTRLSQAAVAAKASRASCGSHCPW